MTYQEKQEARRQRFRDRAKKARQEADQRFKAADAATAGIPFGQPILVGHHSERRHRAALKRQDANMGKAVEASKKADYYEHRAESVGKAGISSDDEQAIEKIRERIAQITAMVDEMKTVNASWRRHGRPEAGDLDAWKPVEAALAHMHVDWPYLRAEMNRNFMNLPGKPRPPYETWMLSNATANRRRLEQRLKALEEKVEAAARAGDDPEELYSGDGWRIVANHGEGRIQILFDAKPDAETRHQCKKQGFRWAPSQGAWQRHLNNSGRCAASYVADQLNKNSAGQ